MSVKTGKRAISVYLLLCVMFLTIILRLLSISTGSYASVSNMTSLKRIEVAESRGCIYDTDYKLFVNTESDNYAALLPDYTILNKLPTALSSDKADAALEKLNKGQLAIVETDCNFGCESAYSYKSVKRFGSDFVCSHIIGYTDSTGKNGVCGIEKAFDSLLDSYSGTLSLGYTQSGHETVLPGCGFSAVNNNYLSCGGIVLTIDKNLQTFIENAAVENSIVTGACVVLDVENSAVLACASFPDFSPNELQSALEDKNEPFLNRAFCAYPVGSVFKPFVAASAMENGIDTAAVYNCTGAIDVGGKTFRCYASTAHGKIGISEAIEKSCNCYFINLGLLTGRGKIIDTVGEFGFGKETFFADGIVSASGNLPTAESIDSEQALANLCFGQGTLTATPMQIAAAYAAFANGGYYRTPYILKQQIDGNGKVTAYYLPDEGRRIISESTASSVSECLYNNIKEGLGVNAKPEKTTAAGKTATAQTGRYNNGQEILDTWFAGFFPYENPKYVIVIFKENGSTASKDCAPMFKAVADYMNVSS